MEGSSSSEKGPMLKWKGKFIFQLSIFSGEHMDMLVLRGGKFGDGFFLVSHGPISQLKDSISTKHANCSVRSR